MIGFSLGKRGPSGAGQFVGQRELPIQDALSVMSRFEPTKTPAGRQAHVARRARVRLNR